MGLWLLYILLGWTPLFFATWLAGVLGELWCYLDARHRRRAEENMVRHLGVRKERARELGKSNYRHYALTLLEIARLARMDRRTAETYIDATSFAQVVKEGLAAGKGLVVVTGHLGNWEWGSLLLSLGGAAVGVIAKPMDNPWINSFLDRIRNKAGMQVWSKQGAIRRAMQTLRQGQGFAAVIDQDGGTKGFVSTFLGAPASTMSLPVALAIRMGSPILVSALIREGGALSFRAVQNSLHWPKPGVPEEEDLARLVLAVNNDLSEIIRSYPEQWIWIHNRWKTVSLATATPAAPLSPQVG
jgi:KDO2-lipid IV(A) lauroyltransferase